MFSRVLVAALASVAVAAPIDSAILASVEKALTLPNGTHDSSVAYYWQRGNAGACGLYSEDSDLVVGLPLEFYNDTGSVSPYCGSYVVVTNPLNNETVTSRIADASATDGLLSLSVATWRALNGDGTDLQNVTWHFANATEEAEAKASVASAAFTAQTTIAQTTAAQAQATTSSAAAQTTVAAAAAASPEEKTTTTKAWTPATTTTRAATTTEKPYVAPTTTTTQKPYTTTTQRTTTQARTTTKAASYSSSQSGTYSGTATYFYQGGNPGNCGNYNSDSAYIVALDSRMYAGGSHCGQQVRITGNGRTITATVADSCPTCVSSGSLDLSVAAFQALSSLSAGVVSITWSFV